MTHELVLRPSVTSPSDARLFVVEWARAWGYGLLVPAAALLTSELASNAVEHVGDTFTIEVTNLGYGLRVSVHDRSPVLPALADPHEWGTQGLGLRLLDRVASYWGAKQTDAGKCVWFDIAVTDVSSRLS